MSRGSAPPSRRRRSAHRAANSAATGWERRACASASRSVNFLPYVTGGLSFAQLSTDINGIPFGTQSKINMSWTAGVGLEYLLWDRWSAKIEYLYIDSSGITCDVACGQTLVPVSGTFTQNAVSFNLHENVVRLGLNYRLWNFY